LFLLVRFDTRRENTLQVCVAHLVLDWVFVASKRVLCLLLLWRFTATLLG
jgi:hypothetical protein